MRFGVNTFIWAASFDPKLIPLDAIKRNGADGIEVPLFKPDAFDAEGVKLPVNLLRRKALATGAETSGSSIQRQVLADRAYNQREESASSKLMTALAPVG